MPHNSQIYDPLLHDIFEDSPYYDSDKADDDDFPRYKNYDTLQLFNQSEYSAFIRDLWLSEGSSKILRSKLN